MTVASPLRAFGPEIWLGDGPVVSFYGFRYPTRMAVIRLADGSLFVWSPIALSIPLRRDVDVLGAVRYVVSPNRLHHLYLGDWKATYPQARLYASPGLRRKRRDLAFDAELGDEPEAAWAGQIEQVPLRGARASSTVAAQGPRWRGSWRGRSNGSSSRTENRRARTVHGSSGAPSGG